jgi:hypothetical protein
MDAATHGAVAGASVEIAALHITENSLQVGIVAPEFRPPIPRVTLSA